ncbi:MAG: hypothetical protein R3A47_06920 [Polyangiales bacterium]
MRLLHGDIDTALVFAFGKFAGPVPDIMNIQNDLYYASHWPRFISAAAIQAQAMLDAGKATERDFAEVAVRNRKQAMNNPNAHVKGEFSVVMRF